ncbi:MAG: hypothetical protein ACYTGP_09845 [Planctomycetota bacterium]|jgi:hypothetical protein
MTRITITFGLVLVLLGLGAYAYALTGEQASMTALIPAFFGVPILILGLATTKWPARRAMFMHIAVLIAVLGLAGAARGLTSLPALVGGDEVARPAAVVVQSIMAVLCLAYVVAAVRSFVAARAKS